MTNALQKTSLSEFTRAEFTEFVEAIGQAVAPTEAAHGEWVRHWDSINPHPEKSDLMYWPADGKHRTNQEIVAEIERFCVENGLPAFKDSPKGRA